MGFEVIAFAPSRFFKNFLVRIFTLGCSGSWASPTTDLFSYVFLLLIIIQVIQACGLNGIALGLAPRSLFFFSICYFTNWSLISTG